MNRVNNQQAKEILLFYRPGAAEGSELLLAEALELAQRDPELKSWFAAHCALQAAIREKLRQIIVPEGLKEQILAECPARRKIIWWQQPVLLAAAAAVVLVIGLSLFWSRPRENKGLSVFSNRMAGAVLRTYSMTLETNDLNQIRAHLAQNQAPINYVLPKGLQTVPVVGCGVLQWHNKPVSMICFASGQPLAQGQKSDLFLFVVDRSSLPDAPPENQPRIAKVNKLMTASWSSGDKVYLLGGFGDEDFIRKYL